MANRVDVQKNYDVLLSEVKRKLVIKNDCYADQSNFYLNFDQGAALLGVSRVHYALALTTKHIVRLCSKWMTLTTEDLLEALTDIIAYLVLIYGMIEEKR